MDRTEAEVGGALGTVEPAAVERFLLLLRRRGVAHECRAHEPARHARHLAAIWGAALHETGRATLFGAGPGARLGRAPGGPVLALVPADRKVAAPRFRDVLGVSDLRVLRGDRGVGRLGWSGMSGPPGALPALPSFFGARGFVDQLVLEAPRLVIALGGACSIAVGPQDYVRLTGAVVARFAGTTRLLPEGGMVDEAPIRSQGSGSGGAPAHPAAGHAGLSPDP